MTVALASDMDGETGSTEVGPVLPDLVYSVRSGPNEELRYSLRSVSVNAAGLFRKVWIVGNGLPSWLRNVNIIAASDDGGRGFVTRNKAKIAVNHPGMAATLLLMDDDFFLVDPIDEWPAFHLGPTSEYLAKLAAEGRTPSNSRWVRTISLTADWMAARGHEDVLARQGHRPLLWDRAKLATVLDEYPADQLLDVAGLYDIAGAGGVGRRGVNSKIGQSDEQYRTRMAERDVPWLSSNEKAFAAGLIGEHIRSLFPDPSRFEAV